MNIIKAIVIKTNTTLTDSNYCLYAVPGDNSVFRFAEKELFGVSDFDHDCSFITKNGIPDISKKCDLLESGNTVQSNDVTIRLKNTTQFDKFLSSNNISLLKSTVEFYTFVGTDTDSDSVGVFLDGTRTIESIEYTETELVLKVKMSLSKQRNKRLSATLDQANYPYIPESNKDKLIPVLFGSSDPFNGRYFKILQSVGQNDTLKVIDTVLYDDAQTYNPYSYKFPAIYDSLDAKTAMVQIEYALNANDLITEVNTDHPDWFDGLFLFCTDGSQGIQNTAREISDYMLFGEIMPDTRVWIGVVLRDYLPETPKGNLTFNATDQAYFELHRVEIKYIVSYYDILGFYDSVTGISQSINYDLYGFIDATTIEKLMSSSFEYQTANKLIDVNPRIFNNTELTTLLNYDCYPADRIEKMVRTDFDAIGETGADFYLPTLTYVPGLNLKGSTLSGDVSSVDVTGSYFNAIDRQTGSGHRWINVFNGVDPGSGSIAEVGYKIYFPNLPENFKFTKCYLGLNLKTSTSVTVNFITGAIKARVFLQQQQDISEYGSGFNVLNVDNIPDFYYLTDPKTGNYNFFYEIPNLSGGQFNQRGHKNFEIESDNIKDLKNIDWIGVITEIYNDTWPLNIESIFEEACFIFEREQDISGEILV